MTDAPADLVLVLLILAFAGYRATRLIVLDDVVGEWPSDEHPRGTFLRKGADIALFRGDGEARSTFTDYVGKLYACTFCVGWWVSLLLVCWWFDLWPWDLGVAGWISVFAVGGLQGFVSSRHNA